MRILIIGCGSIGSVLAKAVHDMPEVDRLYVTDMSADYARHLVDSLEKAEYVSGKSELLCKVLTEVDLAVEAASQEAARRYVPFVLRTALTSWLCRSGVHGRPVQGKVLHPG